MTERKVGRELDAEVAERVFGATWQDSDAVDRHIWRLLHMEGDPDRRLSSDGGTLCLASGGVVRTLDNLRMYSTDIAAAWSAVDEMRNRGFLFHLSTASIDLGGATVSAHFWRLGDIAIGQHGSPSHAESAPLAICLAALEALDRLASTPGAR